MIEEEGVESLSLRKVVFVEDMVWHVPPACHIGGRRYINMAGYCPDSAGMLGDPCHT